MAQHRPWINPDVTHFRVTSRRITRVYCEVTRAEHEGRGPSGVAFSSRPNTTAGLCALFCLRRRHGAMSSRREAEDWAEELEAVAGRIPPRFGRAEPRRRALTYLQGL